MNFSFKEIVTATMVSFAVIDIVGSISIIIDLRNKVGHIQSENIPVSVCGEMAGDPKLTRLLLGMGLRIFSMHPSQVLEVKSRVLKAEVNELAPIVRRMLRLDEPGKLQEALEKLNA